MSARGTRPQDEPSGVRALDRMLVRELSRLFPGASDDMLALAERASAAVADGHGALRLASAADDWQWSDARLDHARADLRAWRAVGSGEPGRPLVLDAHDRLYLRRYHAYETRVCDDLRLRAARVRALDREASDAARAAIAGAALDPDQHAAVAHALDRDLLVLLGGPGSGKTHTVRHLIAALVACGRVDPARVRLAAPTGKAAARLGESLASALPSPAGAREGAASRATTLHALIGAVPGTDRVRHDRELPLDCGLLVVDEASMVDLPLFARTLDALPPHAMLVLLGDPDQLASVEVGSVLHELAQLRRGRSDAGAGAAPGSVSDCVRVLRGHHRSDARMGFPAVLDALHAASHEALDEALRAAIGVRRLPDGDDAQALALASSWFAGIVDAQTPDVAWQASAQARVLTAVREGPYGAAQWNERLMRRIGLATARGVAPRRGTPLLVTRNDVASGLANGDVVLAWGDAVGAVADHALVPGADGRWRRLELGLLPPWEPAFAMTVHKAQGSEYARVLLVVPSSPLALLTREWLYTAMSRQRTELALLATGPVLREALSRSARRESGIADALADDRSIPDAQASKPHAGS